MVICDRCDGKKPAMRHVKVSSALTDGPYKEKTDVVQTLMEADLCEGCENSLHKELKDFLKPARPAAA